MPCQIVGQAFRRGGLCIFPGQRPSLADRSGRHYLFLFELTARLKYKKDQHALRLLWYFFFGRGIVFLDNDDVRAEFLVVLEPNQISGFKNLTVITKS